MNEYKLTKTKTLPQDTLIIPTKNDQASLPHKVHQKSLSIDNNKKNYDEQNLDEPSFKFPHRKPNNQPLYTSNDLYDTRKITCTSSDRQCKMPHDEVQDYVQRYYKRTSIDIHSQTTKFNAFEKIERDIIAKSKSRDKNHNSQQVTINKSNGEKLNEDENFNTNQKSNDEACKDGQYLGLISAIGETKSIGCSSPIIKSKAEVKYLDDDQDDEAYSYKKSLIMHQNNLDDIPEGAVSVFSNKEEWGASAQNSNKNNCHISPLIDPTCIKNRVNCVDQMAENRTNNNQNREKNYLKLLTWKKKGSIDKEPDTIPIEKSTDNQNNYDNGLDNSPLRKKKKDMTEKQLTRQQNETQKLFDATVSIINKTGKEMGSEVVKNEPEYDNFVDKREDYGLQEKKQQFKDENPILQDSSKQHRCESATLKNSPLQNEIGYGVDPFSSTSNGIIKINLSSVQELSGSNMKMGGSPVDSPNPDKIVENRNLEVSFFLFLKKRPQDYHTQPNVKRIIYVKTHLVSSIEVFTSLQLNQ